MVFRADLHIHSCLSPCASLEMSPSAIVKRALESGMNCLALTDHNCALNCAVMEKLCNKEGIFFLPGLEVCTEEEAHVVCLFDSTESALALNNIVYEKLPRVKNIPEKFGDQVYVNEHEEIEGSVEKYLGLASTITVEQLRQTVYDLGGLFIPAHVDKPVFSIVSQLGFLSGEYSAVEIANPNRADYTLNRMIAPYSVICSSDSHYLHQIGSKKITFEMPEASFASLKDVLENRKIQL